MLGNEAVARGAYEAGVKVVSSYPGTPSTEITETIATYDRIYCEWATNEKVASEVAIGASIRGARAMTCMKHVGMNVAADPMFTAAYEGVNGGLVFVVADDPGMHSSQDEQDSRTYGRAAKLMILEPSDSQESKDFAKKAFELSERFDTPVILRMHTRVSHSRSVVELSDPEDIVVKPYEKNVNKYVMMPAMAIKRHVVVEQRTLDIAKASNEEFLGMGIHKIEMNDTKLGIITAGASYQYVKEGVPSASVLKLGCVWPLPMDLIRDFASKVDRLVVVEELDPFMETEIKAAGIACEGKDLFTLQGEYNARMIRSVLSSEALPEKALDLDKLPKAPGRPPLLCAGCPHKGMFLALNRAKVQVMGDIGCYTLGTLPPTAAMDVSVCMGASVGMAHGFDKATDGADSRKTVGVIGDSTFLHSGITNLLNAVYNQSSITLIILDNSITGMTGHQQNPTTGLNLRGDPAGKIDLEALVRAMGINRVRVVDPYNLAEAESAVKEELEAEEPSVIISRRPCALLKKVKRGEPIQVNPDKCKSCKACMKLGCPAISFKDGHAHVDTTQCFGCKVCSELCKFGAFEDMNGEAIKW